MSIIQHLFSILFQYTMSGLLYFNGGMVVTFSSYQISLLLSVKISSVGVLSWSMMASQILSLPYCVLLVNTLMRLILDNKQLYGGQFRFMSCKVYIFEDLLFSLVLFAARWFVYISSRIASINPSVCEGNGAFLSIFQSSVVYVLHVFP